MSNPISDPGLTDNAIEKLAERLSSHYITRLEEDWADAHPGTKGHYRKLAESLLDGLLDNSGVEKAVDAAFRRRMGRPSRDTQGDDRIKERIEADLRAAAPYLLDAHTPDTDDPCTCGHVRHEHHTANGHDDCDEWTRCAHCDCSKFTLDLAAIQPFLTQPRVERCPTCLSSNPWFTQCNDRRQAEEETGRSPSARFGCTDPWHQNPGRFQPVPGDARSLITNLRLDGLPWERLKQARADLKQFKERTLFEQKAGESFARGKAEGLQIGLDALFDLAPTQPAVSRYRGTTGCRRSLPRLCGTRRSSSIATGKPSSLTVAPWPSISKTGARLRATPRAPRPTPSVCEEARKLRVENQELKAREIPGNSGGVEEA